MVLLLVTVLVFSREADQSTVHVWTDKNIIFINPLMEFGRLESPNTQSWLVEAWGNLAIAFKSNGDWLQSIL